MNFRLNFLFLNVVVAAILCSSSVLAQHQHSGHQRFYQPSYHINHQNHTIRDRHGHVIGRYHNDVIHRDSTYVIPHANTHGSGSYYFRNGRFFYVPQTSFRHQTYSPEHVAFGSFSHVDELASRLETLANEFCLDLHFNYSHNYGFRETYREAYQVLQVAKYIHAAEHQHDRRAIREKLGGLDQLFHHVQDDVRGWSRRHHQQVGQLGIKSKMDMIESTLHHLMNDVGVRPTQASPSDSTPTPIAPPPAP